ncbi:MAG: class I SAM-dependent methyltransferase [bacterium]
MSYGWIDAKKFPFNTLLLMDTWIIRYISKIKNAEFNQNFAVALAANPSVCWYFKNRCPDRKEHFKIMVENAPTDVSGANVRECEIYVLDFLDTFVVYLYPTIMDALPYIRNWEPHRLLSITEFKGKTVLDIGTGTGRLALAAAPYASMIYACEPVDRLREYLREKLERLRIDNIFVVDGTLEKLPFPNESFDIVVSGHVFGDDHRQELRFMNRVTKKGGCIIDCPGEEKEKQPDGPKKAMIELGFEYVHYESILGGDVFIYWRWKTA